jgi:hypothetical protein
VNIWKIRTAYYWERLLEARGPLAILTVLLAAILIALIWLSGRSSGGGDPWGHAYSKRSDIVCQTHGEGAVTCSPAPEGVKRYREKLRAEREGKGE